MRGDDGGVGAVRNTILVVVLKVLYTGHVVKTRTAAAWLAVALLAFLLPFLAMQVDLSRPARTVTLVALTLLPSLVAFRCLRFLATQEKQHTKPTPEMMFIFGLAITVPMTLTVVVLITLSNYN